MLASIFAKYDFVLEGKHNPLSAIDSDVGMTFGATIHTKNGLNVKVKKRVGAPAWEGKAGQAVH